MKKRSEYKPISVLSNSERVFLSCTDKCCHLLVERGFDGQYVFTFLYGPNSRRINSIWNRLKNAAKILCGKPISHGELIAERVDFGAFVKQLEMLQAEEAGQNV